MHRSHSELNLAAGRREFDFVTQEVDADHDDDSSEYRGIDIDEDNSPEKYSDASHDQKFESASDILLQNTKKLNGDGNQENDVTSSQFNSSPKTNKRMDSSDSEDSYDSNLKKMRQDLTQL
jgi:hypothetical protein